MTGRAQATPTKRLGGLILVLLPLLLLAGCRRDMQDQPRLEPYEASSLFANGMASRPLPAGTVARGHLREDTQLYEGKDEAGEFLAELPIPLDRELLLRGRSRFEIYCSVCHDSSGSGRGMIVRRGFKQPTTFHDPRLQEEPVGYFYDVVTNGFGVMSSYARQLSVEDRWAVAAYVRALQLSQRAVLTDLPTELQDQFHQALAQQASHHEAGQGEHADAEGGHHE